MQRHCAAAAAAGYIWHASLRSCTRRSYVNIFEIQHRLEGAFPQLAVKVAAPDFMNFGDSLQLMVNSSILLMHHGSAIPHTLFLPKGAVVLGSMPYMADPQAAGWVLDPFTEYFVHAVQNVTGLSHLG